MQAKESWWWSGEVQKAIMEKEIHFKTWQKEENKEKFSKYNLAKKEAKKTVSEAKFNAYESLYKRFETRRERYI